MSNAIVPAGLVGDALVADSEAHENVCERGALPMQAASDCRLTSRRCGARPAADAIARLGWR